MIYVILDDDGRAIDVAETFEAIGANTKYATRNTWNEQQATVYAEQLSSALDRPYMAVQMSSGHNRKFDIIPAPRVGDPVSYAFAGDCYPCGRIIRISPTMKKIVTDHDKVFYRRGHSGLWFLNNTWTLVPGHHYTGCGNDTKIS